MSSSPAPVSPPATNTTTPPPAASSTSPPPPAASSPPPASSPPASSPPPPVAPVASPSPPSSSTTPSTPSSSSSSVSTGLVVGMAIGGVAILAYPRRPESLVLRQFCLEVKPGTSVGLVGKSVCGKSTVIALVQRFYDVERGAVMVDGVDIRSLDIGWYRRHIALVSQEPVLYSGSIRDNIVFGKLDAIENEVVEAARAANAQEFISALKDGYKTE
ncbi:putative ABC transporter B family member 8 [Camellia sinensis]|uniref:putative ABC transporter B family member 8 n=1 Tax=Camellia sinensis TaxID=4442 RepID=UPI001036D7C4|nr:putative ABC transporter B family member 8 [Camellia sinensis]